MYNLTDHTHNDGVLLIFSGLPGTGKTTLSRLLAKRLGAMYLRVDTVEHELSRYVTGFMEDKGYRILYKLAADNLLLGRSVVADSCNPIDITRSAWEKVANDCNVTYVNIEIICSNKEEHRRRIETRISDIDGFTGPTWNEVLEREYQSWSNDIIQIDTALKSQEDCIEELFHNRPFVNI